MALELLVLYVNISQFKYLLTKADFNCTPDHLDLTYFLKSKTEPASVGIKRLLEVFSAYNFNLCFMTHSNFLSRVKVD